MNGSLIIDYKMEKMRHENGQIENYYINNNTTLKESCQKVGISTSTFYNRRKKIDAYHKVKAGGRKPIANKKSTGVNKKQIGGNKNLTKVTVIAEDEIIPEPKSREHFTELKKTVANAKSRK